jgi:hypothetical protein
VNNTYSVYRHVFPDDSVYVGITNQTPNKRWGDGLGYERGNPKLFRKILDFGWDNIEHEILNTSLTEKEALAIEKETILFEKANRGIGKVLNIRHNATHNLPWWEKEITRDLAEKHKYEFMRWDDCWLENVKKECGAFPFSADIHKGYIVFTFVSVADEIPQTEYMSLIYPDYVYSLKDLHEWLKVMKSAKWVKGVYKPILEV